MQLWLQFFLKPRLKSRLCVSIFRDWRTGLEVLECDPATLSFGSTLPGSLHTLILENFDEDLFGNLRSLPQLCTALRGMTALEHLSLIGQDLRLHLVPLLAGLQHCTLLTHLNIQRCSLTGLPEG